jgi:hypothetical protein
MHGKRGLAERHLSFLTANSLFNTLWCYFSKMMAEAEHIREADPPYYFVE